ncbi:MAG: PAS domain S-box protein [Alphaproteobacteria bacterium]|nr:MAG: PAS domain S-box protein [Alphaproteobacteria bacterium]
MARNGTQQRGVFESERRFRLLVEGVVDYAICMLDPNGIVTNWNAGAKRIKGYEAAEVIGRHFGMFYLPEDREAGMPARSLAAARENGKFEAEGWLLRKDGTKFLASDVIDAIYEDGQLVGFAKITRDITERNKAADALKESERHFRLLVNGVTDYALYMLDPNGIVTNWNAGGLRIKGYSPEEIIGQHFSRFYSPADQAAGRPARALQLAVENGRYEEEGWRVRKDGTFFWASVVIDPIRDDDNKLLGFAKITRDISERREAQLNLEKIQRQLAESQKLDALGQLTGGVAHDFNNLLMVITGHVHMLKKIAGNDAKSLRAIQAIETATQRGASLTRQLLTFARRQSVNPQPIDLRDSIHSVREVLDTGLGSAVQLRINLDDGIWPVMVDPAELETALVNLIINARDAMPDGGSVSVRASNVHIDNGTRKGDHVAIEVKDTGVGIPPDIMGKVFDPFFTTKPIGKGTGLGLSQVHGFAHQAGGTVAVASELGKGTTFTVCLPRGQLGIAPAEAETRSIASGTVLLVEDNPDVATASADLLEQLGYSVRWVSDAEAALKELDRDGIDLVFTDIVMPGKTDGLGLARAIKQKHPGVPILLATGYSEAARNAPADFSILRKPFRLHELSRALSELCR